MCGIAAYLGASGGAETVYRCIQILQNRGYDSCGLVTVDNEQDRLLVHKYASTPELSAVKRIGNHVAEHQETGHCHLVHSRWATSSEISDRNAHPHLESKDKFP